MKYIEQDTVYNEEQQNNIVTRLNQGQAREALIETFSYGVVASLNSWLAPIIPAVKRKIPAGFMNAIETFCAQGPLPELLSKLPFYIQTAHL